MSEKQFSFGERGEWYVVAQVVLWGLIAVAPFTPWHWPLLTGEGVGIIRWLGLLLLLAGLGGVNMGLLSLGWGNMSALPYPRAEARFVAQGAYKYVRHPIYSGILIGAVGWTLLVNDLLSLLLTAVLFLLFDRKASREEKWLRARYPEYASYAASTRKLIPWIY